MSWRYCADSYRLVGNQVLDFLLGGHTGSEATIFGHTIGKEKPIVISNYFAATVCFLSCCMTYITELTASSMQNGWSVLCCMLHVWFDCWFNLAARLVWLEMHVCYVHFFCLPLFCLMMQKKGEWCMTYFTTNNCLDVAQTFPDILSTVAQMLGHQSQLYIVVWYKKGAEAARPIAIQHICQRYDMNLCIYIYIVI